MKFCGYGFVGKASATALIASTLLSTAAYAETFDVREAQNLLSQLGFNPGPIDGSYGQKTIDALSNFYLSQGKKFDGEFDENEVVDLKSAAEKASPYPVLEDIKLDEYLSISTSDEFQSVMSGCRIAGLYATNSEEIDPGDCHGVYFYYGDFQNVFIHLGYNQIYFDVGDYQSRQLLTSEIVWEVVGEELLVSVLSNGASMRLVLSDNHNPRIYYGSKEFPFVYTEGSSFIDTIKLTSMRRDEIFRQKVGEWNTQRARVEAELKIHNQIELVRAAFSELSAQQRMDLQDVLHKVEGYRKNDGAEWSDEMEGAILRYLDNNSSWSDLRLPGNSVEATSFVTSIISHFEKKDEHDRLEEARRLEIRRLEEEERIKIEEERIVEEGAAMQFCEKAASSDFWRRFEYLNSKPISILGLDMSMTAKERSQILECRNYSCAEKTNVWGAINTSCTKDRSEIIVDYDQVTFDCESLSICGLDLYEVAQSLVDTGKIDRLEPEQWQDLDGNFHMQYCGRGAEMDVICVREFTFLAPMIFVDLKTGNLGKASPSFD